MREAVFNYDKGLMPHLLRLLTVIALTGTFLLSSDPAHALRCGNKLVLNGMYEFEVIAICGEPVSRLHTGFILRSYRRPDERLGSGVETYYPGYGFREQLAVTELFYNFGPRKLMRKLRFEGGRLRKIETAGYGYLEKDR